MAGRIGDADARSEVTLLRLRLIEGQHARNVRDVVEFLRALAERNGSVFIAQAEIQREVRLDAPGIVGVWVYGNLVAVENHVPDAAFGEVIGSEVLQIQDRAVVVVLSAGPLREALRRDVFVSVESYLDRVLAFRPGEVVG